MKSTLTRDARLLLMRYADGETTPEESRSAEAILRQHPEAADFLFAQEVVGDALRAGARAPASVPANLDVANVVMARMAAAGSPNVIPFARPAGVAGSRAPRASRTLRAVAWGSTAVATLAVAASAFLVLRPSGGDATTAGAHGVEVQGVEAPNPVSVFYLPSVSDVKAQSVVVWIHDDEEAGAATPLPRASAKASAEGEKKP